ncbi:MAG: hypothetical protein ABSA75_13610 [Candidatus Bathyarchaeia archaeon]|jgi:hypothetical protein
MYNGKIFPTKTRKLAAIVGLALLTVITFLMYINIIGQIVFDVFFPVFLVVFAWLPPLLIRRHEKKQANNPANPL